MAHELQRLMVSSPNKQSYKDKTSVIIFSYSIQETYVLTRELEELDKGRGKGRGDQCTLIFFDK